MYANPEELFGGTSKLLALIELIYPCCISTRIVGLKGRRSAWFNQNTKGCNDQSIHTILSPGDLNYLLATRRSKERGL
jgi:hypothetical protein